MTSWSHPELGQFEFDRISWNGEVSLSGISKFWDEIPEEIDWKLVEVGFVTEANPSERMVGVLQDLIKNHHELFSEGVRVMFGDISGEGPDSGMWWHNNIDQVNKILAVNSQHLDKAEDLFVILGLPSIYIQENVSGYEDACAMLEFSTSIDEEHGVAWLTDGKKILGTGYRNDTSPTHGL